MNATTITIGTIAAVISLFCWASFLRGVWTMVRAIAQGQKVDSTRYWPVGPRLWTMLKEFVGHTRMVKFRTVGWAHWLVMFGFLAVPVYRTVVWSFQQVTYGEPGTFVGFAVLLGVASFGFAFLEAFDISAGAFEPDFIDRFGDWFLLVSVIAIAVVLGIAILLFRRAQASRETADRAAARSIWLIPTP